jgi:hypothetical protein
MRFSMTVTAMVDIAAALAVLENLKSPLPAGTGTLGERENVRLNNSCPLVPDVPTTKRLIDLSDVLERAAILEFEGGHSRADADRLALAEYGLTGWDGIPSKDTKGVTA